MSWYEVDAYLSGMNEMEHDQWEQTRLIMYTIAQCNSRKRLTPKEVLRLPWDEEKPKGEDIDWAEVERMRTEIKLEQLSKKKNGSK